MKRFLLFYLFLLAGSGGVLHGSSYMDVGCSSYRGFDRAAAYSEIDLREYPNLTRLGLAFMVFATEKNLANLLRSDYAVFQQMVRSTNEAAVTLMGQHLAQCLSENVMGSQPGWAATGIPISNEVAVANVLLDDPKEALKERLSEIQRTYPTQNLRIGSKLMTDAFTAIKSTLAASLNVDSLGLNYDSSNVEERVIGSGIKDKRKAGRRKGSIAHRPFDAATDDDESKSAAGTEASAAASNLSELTMKTQDRHNAQQIPVVPTEGQKARDIIEEFFVERYLKYIEGKPKRLWSGRGLPTSEQSFMGNKLPGKVEDRSIQDQLNESLEKWSNGLSNVHHKLLTDFLPLLRLLEKQTKGVNTREDHSSLFIKSILKAVVASLEKQLVDERVASRVIGELRTKFCSDANIHPNLPVITSPWLHLLFQVLGVDKVDNKGGGKKFRLCSIS